MIEKISLQNFGRFERDEFTTAKVTVFYGPNESGKTTLQHALLDALCSLDKRKELGRRIHTRYGAQRRATVSPEKPFGEFDAETLENLFFVDSGKLYLSFDGTTEWLDAVKSSLFAGGIDPRLIAEDLEGEASTRRNKSHMKSYQRDMEQREAKLLELEQLKAQHRDALTEQTQLLKDRERLAVLDDTRGRLMQEISDLELLLEAQESYRRRDELEELDHAIQEKARLERDLESLTHLAEDAEPQLQATEARILKARNELSAVEARRKLLQQQCIDAEQLLDKRHKQSEDLLPHRQTAAELRQTLDTRNPRIRTRHERRWSSSWLIAAGSFLFAGLLAGALGLLGRVPGIPTDALQVPAALGWGMAAVSGVAALALLFLKARTYVSIEDRSELDNAAAEIRKALPQELLQAGEHTEYEALRDRLHAIEAQAAQAEEAAQEAEQNLRNTKAALSAAEAEYQQMNERMIGAEADRNTLLSTLGVRDSAEYSRLRERYRAGVESLSLLKTKLEEAAKKHSIQDIPRLESYCAREIRHIDEQLKRERLTQDEQRIKRNLHDGNRKRLDELEQERELLMGRSEREHGKLSDRLTRLPREVLRLEKEIAGLDSVLQAAELRRKGAAKAAEIFFGIAEDTGNLLLELAAGISADYHHIVGPRDALQLQEFGLERATVPDRSGAARLPEQLSEGTRDAFMLAARLALAVRSRPEAAVFVLDEPFTAFDPERTRNALLLLAQKQDEHPYQYLFFTKDPLLLDLLKEVFPELQLHELEPILGEPE
ncbi:MAG: hypothetical protein EA428_01355 [Spirochaetaceae bacterium]|nr:MAG: hypothetical protein EA428_01355 [Spirochaetaceae bacterium]